VEGRDDREADSSLFPLAGQSVEYGPVRRLTWRAVTTAAVSSLFPLAGQSVEYGPVRRLTWAEPRFCGHDIQEVPEVV